MTFYLSLLREPDSIMNFSSFEMQRGMQLYYANYIMQVVRAISSIYLDRASVSKHKHKLRHLDWII